MTMIISGSDGLEFPDGSDQGTAFTGNAATITSGTIATARLATGTANSSTYLRGDQTWAVVTSNPGTVTSVNLTGGTAISVSGGPITSSGSITVNNTGVTSVSASTGISVSSSTGGVTITNTSPNQLTTTTGSPAYYGARAWVNFNGSGTVAIRASVNVSSISDNGNGDYTVNFTTAMPDTNYAYMGFVRKDNDSQSGFVALGSLASDSKTTSAVRVRTTWGFDTTEIDFAAFR